MAYAKKLRSGWTARSEVSRNEEDVTYECVSDTGPIPQSIESSFWDDNKVSKVCRIGTWDKWIAEAVEVSIDSSETAAVSSNGLSEGDEVRWSRNSFFYRGTVLEAGNTVRIRVEATGFDGQRWVDVARKPVIELQAGDLEDH